MNFLAHVFLSGTENQPLLLGNFIGDFVKGKELLNFSPAIQRGIVLHRAIDAYTDAHPIVLRSKKRLFPTYRHYNRVLVDLYYDHLLAANFSRYSSTPLLPYTLEVYAMLQQNRHHIPERAHLLLDHMQAGNWLYHYRTLEGIGEACKGMARRSSFPSGMEKGATDLAKDYAAFEEEFRLFFADLTAYVASILAEAPPQ